MMNKMSCAEMPCCGMNCRDWSLLILRIAVGGIFISHGYDKLFGAIGIDAFTGMLAGLGFPAAGFLAWVVGLTEFVGGIAILLGAYVKQFAIALAVIMAVAFSVVKGFSFSKGEIDLALLGMSVALALGGAGKYSVMACCAKACCKDGMGDCCKKEDGHMHEGNGGCCGMKH